MFEKFYPCSCGCDVFVMKRYVSGISYLLVGANGDGSDNEELTDGLSSKDCWKHYRCLDCGKKAKEIENE